MSPLIVIFTIVCICCLNSNCESTASGVENDSILVKKDKVHLFLEKFKQMMKNGNPDLKLPVLDPFEYEDVVAISMNETILSMEGILSRIRVDGASEYNINDAKFAMVGVKLMLNLTWPMIHAKTNYVVNGSIDNEYNFFGHGGIETFVHDLTFSTTVQLSARKEKQMIPYIKNITSAVHLASLDFKATGLYNDEKVSALLSQVVSEMVPEMVDSYQTDIVKVINRAIVEKANESLQKITMKKILEFLLGNRY